MKNVKKREEIMKMYEDNYSALTFQHFQQYENLIALAYVPDIGDTECDYEEIIFTVPTKWLLKWPWQNDSSHWTEEYMRKWLQNDYNSEDGKEIFNDAMLEREIVTLNIR